MTHPIDRARHLRTAGSTSGQLLWHLLRDRRLSGTKFRRQHPIGPYVVDFACLSKQLVVEVDGPQHQQVEQVEFDSKRDAYLRYLGYRVLRISTHDLWHRTEAVLE